MDAELPWSRGEDGSLNHNHYLYKCTLKDNSRAIQNLLFLWVLETTIRRAISCRQSPDSSRANERRLIGAKL